jgi:hypothetical protein
VKNLYSNLIEATILTGCAKGKDVFVKRKDRKRSLSGKNDHNALWHYRNSHNAKFRVVAVFKQPQRVVACEKQLQRKMPFELTVYTYSNLLIKIHVT